MTVSNISDPDQDWIYVGPDLGPNFLQKLSADSTIAGKELKTVIVCFWVLEMQKILDLRCTVLQWLILFHDLLIYSPDNTIFRALSYNQRCTYFPEVAVKSNLKN